jgi:hypothetical protein
MKLLIMSVEGRKRAKQLKKLYKQNPDKFLDELVNRMLEPESKFIKILAGKSIRTAQVNRQIGKD